MNYLSGEEVQKGDDVLIENRRTLGIVECIIEAEEDMKEWNIEDKGVLVASEPFGSVFWPIEEKVDPVVFVSRSKI